MQENAYQEPKFVYTRDAIISIIIIIIINNWTFIHSFIVKIQDKK